MLYRYSPLSWIKSLISKAFPKDIDVLGLSNQAFEKAMNEWLRVYADKPFWASETHNKTLNLGAAIASEFARLITIEFHSEITGSKRAEFLNEQYERLLEQLRTKLEAGCAVGGLIIKPYVTNGVILPDMITQDKFIPIAYSNGIITSAIFVSQDVYNRRCYTRIEKQTYSFKDKMHRIESKFYISRNTDNIGYEISAEKADRSIWGDIEPEIIINNVDRPLFGFWRVPFANQIDSESPLGVSVYSRAMKLLKQADLQWDRFLWEYDGGQLAVYAGDEAMRVSYDDDGNAVFDTPQSSERLMRKLGISADDDGKSFFEVFNPTLRDDNYRLGLDEIKRQIEFACQLAYGTLSNPQNVDKTAEEIRSSKQRSYTAVRDMQTSLEAALEDYIYAMNVMTNICQLAPKGDYEVSFDWGDGVLEDKDKEQAIQLNEVNSGIRRKTDYIKWRYGVDDKRAKEMIPQNNTIKGFYNEGGGS